MWPLRHLNANMESVASSKATRNTQCPGSLGLRLTEGHSTEVGSYEMVVIVGVGWQ